MSVLAVIPCLNEADHLPGLISQLLADQMIDLLVVADGGSTDGSCEIVLAFANDDARIRLINNPARIQSAGVNLAVAEFGAEFEWLLRVDAHCLYPGNYAQILLEGADSSKATSVVVPMITQGKAGFQLAVAAAQNSVLGTGGSAHRSTGEGGFVDHGHHALMQIDLFRFVGGYCETMPCNEDAELDHRLTKSGGSIWLEPNAAITYFPRSTVPSLWRQYYKYGVGRARNIIRHRMRPHLRQMIPLVVPVALGFALFSRVHWIFGVPALGWILLCLTIGALVGIRNGGGWALLSGLAAAIMHLAWAIGFMKEAAVNRHSSAPKYGLMEGREP